jgi:hypothetical protein
MATEEQKVHMQNLVNQAKQLSSDLANLQSQSSAKRDLFLKVQGAIEYLQQIGVSIPTEDEPEQTEDEPEQTEEESEQTED